MIWVYYPHNNLCTYFARTHSFQCEMYINSIICYLVLLFKNILHNCAAFILCRIIIISEENMNEYDVIGVKRATNFHFDLR